MAITVAGNKTKQVSQGVLNVFPRWETPLNLYFSWTENQKDIGAFLIFLDSLEEWANQFDIDCGKQIQVLLRDQIACGEHPLIRFVYYPQHQTVTVDQPKQPIYSEEYGNAIVDYMFGQATCLITFNLIEDWKYEYVHLRPIVDLTVSFYFNPDRLIRVDFDNQIPF